MRHYRIVQLAAALAGGILIYAGIVRDEWGKTATTALLAGGLLLLIFAFYSQFDQSKRKR